jgi:bifunctional non-homologous end joining protein LigD
MLTITTPRDARIRITAGFTGFTPVQVFALIAGPRPGPFSVTILPVSKMPTFHHMRLARRPKPFDHPDWLYEIKFDGFRALAYVEDGKCSLVSRRSNEYRSFHELCKSIADRLTGHEAVLDGEIVSLDQFGRSQFYELMFRRGAPFFYAFDLLWLNGEDLRGLPLLDRKKRLRKLILPRNGSRLLYLDHIEGNGSRLFAKACEFDLEGIVAKWSAGQYVASDRRSSWVKIKNPRYSQAGGREELFERP